jgi:hypothetical protein
MLPVRIMITDHGKHPPEKWAEVATDEIIQIATNSSNALLHESLAFRGQLIDLFTKQFAVVMEAEQEAIANKHNHSLHSEAHVEPARQAICALAEGTSFVDHFANPEVQQHIERVCNTHFKSAMLVERLHEESSKGQETPTASRATKVKLTK